MLHHHNTMPRKPARTVILGAGGFIGGAIMRHRGSSGDAVLGLGRKEIDLLDAHAADKLGELLRADDALVVVAAWRRARTRR